MRNTIIKYQNNRLKELRKQAGLKQSEIALLLDMQCEDRICRWERGTSVPNVPNLFKLAQLFDVLPHELYPELFQDKSESHNR